MYSTKIDVLDVIDNSYPIFVNFQILDCHGVYHNFHEKSSVVKLHYFDDGSLTGDGTIKCKIIKVKEDTFIIDTSEPNGIVSVDGLHEFEVNKSGTGRLLKWQYPK
ncbi:MAG: hypothetical protein J6B74_00130 [Ruminococcus sp.]|nr:hypothetical protein [Ruminococcus sp.]